MISSEKPPPFLPEYSSTKKEGELYLLNKCPNLAPYILRPGFIVNREHRIWSTPLALLVDFAFHLNELIFKRVPGGHLIDFLFPAKSNQLSTIADLAAEGVMGNLDLDKNNIVTNADLNEMES